MNYQSSSHQSPPPCWSRSLRSLACATALGVVAASVSPALASVSSSVTLDAVTTEEGYPIERNYCRVGRGRACALPPPARSNGSCSFPASRFPMWSLL